jgi:PKHD-type hydroxylase
MKHYYIRKILDDDQISQINDIIDQSNKNNYWIDGLVSGGGSKNVKNNLEMTDINSVQIINSLIMNKLDEDKNFVDFTVPLSTQPNIISKTQQDGYYNPHKDSWINGDYSTTVFLNDPDEYSGGELCLYFGGEDEIKIKLERGWGITYPTGILHRVNEVTSGNRYVSIFWTKSLIKDPFIRFIYNEIGNIENFVSKYKIPIKTENCINSTKNPIFVIDNLKNEILRRYS